MWRWVACCCNSGVEHFSVQQRVAEEVIDRPRRRQGSFHSFPVSLLGCSSLLSSLCEMEKTSTEDECVDSGAETAGWARHQNTQNFECLHIYIGPGSADWYFTFLRNGVFLPFIWNVLFWQKQENTTTWEISVYSQTFALFLSLLQPKVPWTFRLNLININLTNN